MIKNLILAALCLVILVILMHPQRGVTTAEKVAWDTKENIETGYRPDIAEHIALVENRVILPDSLYMSLMED